MPELPEVEVIRRDLEKEIVGRRIKDPEIRPGTNAMKIVKRHGRRKELQELLAGAKVDRISRIGKDLLLDLDNGKVLVINLGTTGQLLKTSASDDIATHTHLILSFTIGGQLRLVDPKSTSQVYVVAQDEIADDELSGRFAIDPLDNQPVTWHDFSARLEERQQNLKDLLMDDSFIGGLGPIYSDEVLFASGLRGDRRSDKLSSQDVRRLYRALMETLQDAVRARGTSYGNIEFKDLQGNPGAFQLELKVYEREGEPCRRCRSMVIRENEGGVETYLCPQCQS